LLLQDIDGSGKIRYTEFLAATMEAVGAISEERLAEAFDLLDSDDSGYISCENLLGLLGSDMTQAEIASIINEVDENGDGQISYQEFLTLWDEHIDDRMSTQQSNEATRFYSKDSFSSSSDADGSGKSEHISRQSFLSMKRHSERKFTK
jgi:EF-hand domain pair